MSDLPSVGSLLVAHRTMRAWISDTEKGVLGTHVNHGDTGLVIQAWRVEGQVRIRMLIKDVVVMFSHADNCVWLNWSRADTDQHL